MEFTILHHPPGPLGRSFYLESSVFQFSINRVLYYFHFHLHHSTMKSTRGVQCSIRICLWHKKHLWRLVESMIKQHLSLCCGVIYFPVLSLWRRILCKIRSLKIYSLSTEEETISKTATCTSCSSYLIPEYHKIEMQFIFISFVR